MSKFKGKKTDNAKVNAKVELRENIINHHKNSSNVLEVFCGHGEMYKSVWNKSTKYTGIDKKYYHDKRHTICGDAESVLMQINLSQYNVFDIDAYGSPYNCLDIIIESIIKNGLKNDISFCITDGLQIDLRMGNISRGIRNLLNINVKKIRGINKIHNLIINKIMNNIKLMLNCNIINKKIAIGKTGSSMRYYTFTLCKQ